MCAESARASVGGACPATFAEGLVARGSRRFGRECADLVGGVTPQPAAQKGVGEAGADARGLVERLVEPAELGAERFAIARDDFSESKDG